MSYLTRAAALAARALQSQGSAASRSAVGQNVQQVRAMGGSSSRCSRVGQVLPLPRLSEGLWSRIAGGHAAHGNPNDYVTYAGLTLKKPPTWEYALSKLVGGTMWWVCCSQQDSKTQFRHL